MTGPGDSLSTYETVGFVRDRKIGKHCWVVTKIVEPASLRLTANADIAGIKRAIATRPARR